MQERTAWEWEFLEQGDKWRKGEDYAIVSAMGQ